MKVVFQIRFHSKFGQDLFISADHPLFGMGVPAKAVPLRFKDAETWEGEVTIEGEPPSEPIFYRYLVREPDGKVVADWAGDRRLDFSKLRGKGVVIRDSWNFAGFHSNAFYTEPFRRVLLRRGQARIAPDLRGKPGVADKGQGVEVEFLARAPLLRREETLCLVGSTQELGGWSTSKPILLGRAPEDAFCRVKLRLAGFPAEYKFGVFDIASGRFVRFEEGADRVLTTPPPECDLLIVEDGFARLPDNTWKGAGIAVPVFSLRSEKSFGVGEFSDLKLLADWCVATDMQLIQILPVNDTSATGTWRDSYPYSAISAFALHPMYLRLEGVCTSEESRELLSTLEDQGRKLNTLPEMDYEAVIRLKTGFLNKIFPFEKRILETKEFKQFFAENKSWLAPYALFCVLRDKYGTSDFNRWPEFKTCDESSLNAAIHSTEFRDPVELVFFTQFHLHSQLQEAAAYANERGILLKGDIPIGVYRYGADAWQAPQLYRMDMQAGAPPDAFAVKGQNWGFPTYNWQEMQRTGFSWWKQRFAHMRHYFNAFRIDHILGFFRIWSIPMDCVEGILGFFVPALPARGTEFAERGIHFDRLRYVKPHITEATLKKLFGDAAEEAASRFLDKDRFDQYSLKPEYSTQRQVQARISGNDPKEQGIKEGLYDLISNVLLLVNDSMGDEFHFRFAIEKTPSFQALDKQTQQKMQEFYIDYFFRRQEAFWMQEGLNKLEPLKRVTDMLVCGEDLGLVPDCVPTVMKELGILSLEVQRMPKALGAEFSDPATAPYLSVVTPSTHDMSPIRQWWQEDPARTQRFYSRQMRMTGEAPKVCTPDISRAILTQHLNSPAMWSIFMAQDLLGAEASVSHTGPGVERINDPANPDQYWRYRMHLTLEKLLAAAPLNGWLSDAVRSSGRGPVG